MAPRARCSSLPVHTPGGTILAYKPRLFATANCQEDDEALTDDATEYGSEAGGTAGEEGGEVRVACVNACPRRVMHCEYSCSPAVPCCNLLRLCVPDFSSAQLLIRFPANSST